jgi:manganese catalase
MFFHHKDLAYTVRVDKPNPVFARMLQQAIGGPEGEMRVMNQYLFQGLGHRGPDRYRDMLMSTATEEIGHIEVLATAVAMNLEARSRRWWTRSSRTRPSPRGWARSSRATT